jgi:hypothetical protein
MYIEKSVLWPDRKHPVLSQGRNGNIQTIGVVICVDDTDVDMMPLTSKNKIGNCSLCIPSDPAVLRDLSAKLEAVAQHLEANHG